MGHAVHLGQVGEIFPACAEIILRASTARAVGGVCLFMSPRCDSSKEGGGR